jgi:hypothetical protein
LREREKVKVGGRGRERKKEKEETAAVTAALVIQLSRKLFRDNVMPVHCSISLFFVIVIIIIITTTAIVISYGEAYTLACSPCMLQKRKQTLE